MNSQLWVAIWEPRFTERVGNRDVNHHKPKPSEVIEIRERLWRQMHELNGLHGGNGSVTWKGLEAKVKG